MAGERVVDVTSTDRGEPLLVLLHIPKTAGTTLAQLLRYHYRSGAFKGGGNAFSRLDELDARLRAIAGKPRLRSVAGHLTLGLAERALPAQTRYLTILRDPVARTLSHYLFLVESAHGTGLVPPWLPPHPRDLTLEECLAPRGYIPDNLQTRMLCGLASPYEELPSDALERAKRNLGERLAYVGTTERFDEFLAMLNLALGWPTTAYERARPGPRRTPGQAPEELRRVAEEHNALDRELYAHAERLLELEIAAAGPAFQVEHEVLLRALERWNEGVPAAADVGVPVRALPVDARVELAVKEAELARAELERRRAVAELKRARREAGAGESR